MAHLCWLPGQVLRLLRGVNEIFANTRQDARPSDSLRLTFLHRPNTSYLVLRNHWRRNGVRSTNSERAGVTYLPSPANTFP